MAAFKITALQKALDDCIPSTELDQANKQFTELTEKYRDLLENNNSLVIKTEQTSGYEVGWLIIDKSFVFMYLIHCSCSKCVSEGNIWCSI